MSRPLTHEEFDQVHFKDDVNSYTVLSESLAAFDFPEDFKFESKSPLKKCRNKQLLALLRVRCRFRYHLEFHVGGSGVYKTFVLIVHESIPIPACIKEWFFTRALRHGVESLDSNSRTRSHLSSYDSFKIFPEDRQKVWRETDSYLWQQRLATNSLDDTATYGPLWFLYYRCQEGFFDPGQASESLSQSVSSDTSKIPLIQVSFGTELRHPDLPLFLHLPAALERLQSASDTRAQQCYDLINGGYITCRNPFGEYMYGDITYFRSHNPLNHLIRGVRKANITVDTIFGQFRTCKNNVKRKVAFMKGFELGHAHYLETISERLPLRIEFVENFLGYEEALAALQETPSHVTLLRRVFCTTAPSNSSSSYHDRRQTENGAEDVTNTDSRGQVVIGTFNHNWSFHVTNTGKKYLRALQLAKASWLSQPSKDAVRRMYDAEIKLRYFNYGNSRRNDYSRLKVLMGDRALSCDSDDTGILRYVVHDEDVYHPLSLTVQIDDVMLMDLVLPLSSSREYIETYLEAAAQYNVFKTPHIVLMKAIARVAFFNFGPQFNGWTYLETKDFAEARVANMLAARTSWRQERESERWRISGYISTEDVMAAIETPVNSALAIFFSASLANSSFQRSLLAQYIDDYVSYFPAYLIRESPQTRSQWFRVRRPARSLTLHQFEAPCCPSTPAEPTPKRRLRYSFNENSESCEDDVIDEPQPRYSSDEDFFSCEDGNVDEAQPGPSSN